MTPNNPTDEIFASPTAWAALTDPPLTIEERAGLLAELHWALQAASGKPSSIARDKAPVLSQLHALLRANDIEITKETVTEMLFGGRQNA